MANCETTEPFRPALKTPITREIFRPFPSFSFPGRESRPKPECSIVWAGFACPERHIVKPITQGCGSRSCPICFRSWASKRARVIAATLTGKVLYLYATKLLPKPVLGHFELSPPPERWEKVMLDLPARTAERWIFNYLKDSLAAHSNWLVGGVAALHPYRYDEKDEIWKRSPHLHYIGTSHVQSKKFFEAEGCVYHFENTLKTNADVFRAIRYELGHSCWVAGTYKPAYKYFGWATHNSNSWAKLMDAKVEEVCECPKCRRPYYQLLGRTGNLISHHTMKYTNIIRRYALKQHFRETLIKDWKVSNDELESF